MKVLNYLVFVFLVCGCSGIVKKPEVFNVKRVAIISLQSNQGVYNIREASGGNSFFSIPYISKTNLPAEPSYLPETSGYRLVDFSLNTFEEELSKIKGWQIVPSIKVINSAQYKVFGRSIQFQPTRSIATEAATKKWFTPQGMWPISNSRSELVKEISKMANDLNIDAVALVTLDFAYSPDHASANNLGASGSFASVATSIQIITKSGGTVVTTPDVSRGNGERFSSDISSPLLGKQMTFNDEVETMFKSAIQKSAINLREKINKELL